MCQYVYARGKFDLKWLCSMGGIDSLKREEALDAAAEGDSKSLRKPCAGKPCFDVIQGMSSDWNSQGRRIDQLINSPRVPVQTKHGRGRGLLVKGWSIRRGANKVILLFQSWKIEAQRLSHSQALRHVKRRCPNILRRLILNVHMFLKICMRKHFRIYA